MKLHNNIITFLAELKKSIRVLGLLIISGTVGLYLISPALLLGLQIHLGQKLAFFTVAEPFLAHAKLSFFVTLFACMPAITYYIWIAAGTPFKIAKSAIHWYLLFTCLLFYAGAAFCYFITLPFGINFLLGFQSVQLKPVISAGKFVTFIAIFILAFGVIFELPTFMIFSAKVGLCKRQTFQRHRRYAILAISILAAVLTPTPDIFNMMLMGVPLYLLYEAGIIVMKVLKI